MRRWVLIVMFPGFLLFGACVGALAGIMCGYDVFRREVDREIPRAAR
jgi:hypothetical protein